jgi:hypothetical protein
MILDERKFARRQLIAIGVSAFTLAASIAGVAQMPHPGDTPVVLIGGTVTAKVGSKNNREKWKQKSGKFLAKSEFPIALIVLKNTAPEDSGDNHKDDDDDTNTDRQRIDVSGAKSWQVDVFAQASDTTPIISITSGSDIQLALVNSSGALCKDTRRRTAYSTDKGCTASGKRNATFAKAVVTVDGAVPPNGTLTCTDPSQGPGKCRIVFRYPNGAP